MEDIDKAMAQLMAISERCQEWGGSLLMGYPKRNQESLSSGQIDWCPFGGKVTGIDWKRKKIYVSEKAELTGQLIGVLIHEMAHVFADRGFPKTHEDKLIGFEFALSKELGCFWEHVRAAEDYNLDEYTYRGQILDGISLDFAEEHIVKKVARDAIASARKRGLVKRGKACPVR